METSACHSSSYAHQYWYVVRQLLQYDPPLYIVRRHIRNSRENISYMIPTESETEYRLKNVKVSARLRTYGRNIAWSSSSVICARRLVTAVVLHDFHTSRTDDLVAKLGLKYPYVLFKLSHYTTCREGLQQYSVGRHNSTRVDKGKNSRLLLATQMQGGADYVNLYLYTAETEKEQEARRWDNGWQTNIESSWIVSLWSLSRLYFKYPTKHKRLLALKVVEPEKRSNAFFLEPAVQGSRVRAPSNGYMAKCHT